MCIGVFIVDDDIPEMMTRHFFFNIRSLDTAIVRVEESRAQKQVYIHDSDGTKSMYTYISVALMYCQV